METRDKIFRIAYGSKTTLNLVHIPCLITSARKRKPFADNVTCGLNCTLFNKKERQNYVLPTLDISYYRWKILIRSFRSLKK